MTLKPYQFSVVETLLNISLHKFSSNIGLLDSKGKHFAHFNNDRILIFFLVAGYGIATPKGGIWRDKISLAILELQEKGEIQSLHNKWWKSAKETCLPDEKYRETKANSLNIENIGGVFVVLLCGLAFAVFVSLSRVLNLGHINYSIQLFV